MKHKETAHNMKQFRQFAFIFALWLLWAFIATPCPMAGTFRDDFEDGDLKGWRQQYPFAPEPTFWKIVDGELEGTYLNPASTTELHIGEENWKDYTIEFEMKLLKKFGPGGFCVDARYKNPEWTHFWSVGIGDYPGTWAIIAQRFPGNVMTQKPFDPLELDKWYHIKLEVKGENFTFWVNGKIALEQQDDVVKEGAVGIGLGNYTGRFDNVEISGPDIPDVTPPTWRASPVQPGGKKAMTWGAIKFSR